MEKLICLNTSGCMMGMLVIQNVTQSHSEAFLQQKAAVTDALRERYQGADRQALKSSYPIDCYSAYYKRFGYTYHLVSQLESILGGKQIPSGHPLVECMFMAELKSLLLTAGHDMQKLRLPLRIKSASGEESYTALGGKQVMTVPGDAMVEDTDSVLSSILRGPESNSCIDGNTRNVLFCVYAPTGIREEDVLAHLDTIERAVRLMCVNAETVLKSISK